MSADVVMPRLSDSMEEGTILRWLKSPGEEVALGDELVEIETDKANMVYEAPAAGSLIEVVAAEGDTLPIGEVIARLGEPGEAPSGDGADATGDPRLPAAEAPPGASPSPAEPSAQAAEAPVAAPTAPTAGGDGRVKASPLARRIAKENGLELASVAGSGPGGRIVKNRRCVSGR